MRLFFRWIVLWGLCVLFQSGSAMAKDGQERAGGLLGVGFVLGDLNGLSIKYWPNPTHALQAHVGSYGLNSIGILGTYQYHFRPLTITDKSYSIPFYIGCGGRTKVQSLLEYDTTYVDFGLVGQVGMSVLVPELPVELFLEANPVVVLYNPSVGSGELGIAFGVEGGLGIHYYF